MKRQDELNEAWCKYMGKFSIEIMQALAFALRWADAHPDISVVSDPKTLDAELGHFRLTKTSDQELESKKLDPDEVIAWLVANICDFEYYVKLFKKDFGL